MAYDNEEIAPTKYIFKLRYYYCIHPVHDILLRLMEQHLNYEGARSF